jgi:hypothetical protein
MFKLRSLKHVLETNANVLGSTNAGFAAMGVIIERYPTEVKRGKLMTAVDHHTPFGT